MASDPVLGRAKSVARTRLLRAREAEAEAIALRARLAEAERLLREVVAGYGTVTPETDTACRRWLGAAPRREGGGR